MGHIQQLAFALGPVEAKATTPARPRRTDRAARTAAEPAQPSLPVAPVLPVALPLAIPPVLTAPPPSPAPAPHLPTPPVAVREAPAPARHDNIPLSDASPARRPGGTALYVVMGFAPGRGRRQAGWQRLPDQGFASQRLAEDHAARLIERGRATGIVVARQMLSADADAEDEPVILTRRGDLPEDLLDA